LCRLRKRHPVLEGIPLSYAGRLDPLAEGVLLVLCGTYNKNRNQYLGFDKSYEVEIVFGVSTDTGDVLGVPFLKEANAVILGKKEKIDAYGVTKEGIQELLTTFLGIRLFPYPVYSSKTVSGKALHEWARTGRLSEIVVPEFSMNIHKAVAGEVSFLESTVFFSTIVSKIKAVKGNFRQEYILSIWSKFQVCLPDDFKFIKVCTYIDSGSGSYMRTLAEELGKKIGVPALAFKIMRTRVGPFSVLDCIDLD
jgi:tRNA pseudouridine(55) synthase